MIVFLRNESVTTKIVVKDQITEQIKNFSYLGCKMCYEYDMNCKNKINKFEHIHKAINWNFSKKHGQTQNLKYI